jgi:hypothetical protein
MQKDNKEGKVMFDIGDKVWIAKWEKDKRWETCPHCLGEKCLTIIMGDKTQVSIDCVCCVEAWRSSGKVAIYDYIPKAEEVKLDGYEVKSEKGKAKTSYRSGCWGFDNVFATKEEALVFALAKIEQKKAEDKRQLEYTKEQAGKTWASNATHHIEQIKNFEKQIEYHKTKLAVAKSHIDKKVTIQ